MPDPAQEPSPSPGTPAILPGMPEPEDNQLRRNLSLVTMSWLFGSVYFTAPAGAPLMEFARTLGAQQWHFGVLAALPFAASLLSLPASFWIDASGDRKGIFIIMLLAQRMMWIPIALLPIWFWKNGHQDVALGGFLALIFFTHATGAVGGPAWLSWMSDVVPKRIRGRYFSRRRQWGILSAIPAALITGWLMDHMAEGKGSDAVLWVCAGIFIASSLFGIVDVLAFYWLPHEKPARAASGPSVWRGMMAPLKDRNFLVFSGYVATITLAAVPMGNFLALFLRELGASGTQIQITLLVCPALGQLVVLGLWGKVTDRMGKKPVLAISTLLLFPTVIGWCVMRETGLWMGYVVGVAGAALWAGIEVANLNLVLEMSSGTHGKGKTHTPAAKSSSYAALNAVIINVAGCVGGFAGGVFMQSFNDFHGTFLGYQITSYELLFFMSGVLRLAACGIFIPLLKDPHAKPTYEVFRFMAGNAYNNLTSTLQQPFRLIRRPRDEGA